MQKLFLHPSAHGSVANKLSVAAMAEIKGRTLEISFHIDSPEDAPKLVWNSYSDSGARKDELWKTTCLEAFIQKLDGSYFEVNLAPQGDWNVYRFDSYREGMKHENQIEALSAFSSSMQTNGKFAKYKLNAKIDLSKAMKSPQHFRLGLTAVIETEGSERSYWSLKHSGEKPDFHDSRGFVLEMRI